MNLFREVIAGSPLAPVVEARRLVRTPRFQEQIARLAEKLQRPLPTVAAAESCLREMVAIDSAAYTWLFDHALKLAENRGLAQPGGAELEEKRLAFARECGEHVSAIDTLARLAMGPRAGNAAAATATRETPRVAA